MAKIKYIQFDPAETLLEPDVQALTAEEFGCYWRVILNLYCNEGKLKADNKSLKMLCNCKNFENIWPKIEENFVTKDGFIKHKTVTKRLRQVRKFIRDRRRAGVAGANRRWQSYGEPEANKRNETKSNERKISKYNKPEACQTKRAFGRRDAVKISDCLLSSYRLRKFPSASPMMPVDTSM